MLVGIIIGAVVFLALIIFLMRNSIKPFLRFLVSKLFLINLVLAIGMLSLLAYCSLDGLYEYTNHGEKRAVPYLIGMHMDELEETFDKLDLKYIIEDSTYSDSYPAGTVIYQHPNPEINYDSVKPGRLIHLSVVKKLGELKTLPVIDDPNKKVVSKIEAQYRLESIGFIVKFKTVPDKNNYVKRMEYNGKQVKGGDKLLKGSNITVVVGSGGGGTPVDLPNVKGMTVLEANQKIVGANLNFEVNYSDPALNQADSLNFIIKSQNPTPYSVPQGIVSSGTTVSVIAVKPNAPATSDSTLNAQ